jgi:hypothetical protein
MALTQKQTTPASSDVVAVFDATTGLQLFAGARPIKAMINESSKFMEHPLESGASVTDHKIFMPIEIGLQLILDAAEYRSIYQQIRDAYTKSTKLSIQLKAATYSNMYIVEMPHDEDTDFFDTIALALKLKEVRFADVIILTLPPAKVRRPKDASTTKNGQQTGKAPTPATQEKAKKVVSQSLSSKIFGFGG